MRPAALGALLLAALLAWGPAMGETGATAAEWRRDCAPYVKILQGEEGGDDIDLAYCAGLTQGVLSGLATGSQIGALSMGSILVVQYELDSQAVFESFSQRTEAELLRFCVPAEAPTSTVIQTVYAFLGDNPDRLTDSVAAVFFSALQEKFPC